ncbi:ATP-binding protein [Candidatus Pacearchaeota archaeon]|nr:ATP-binding protein [Candidatus Pacearchaeota archaeon]
MIKEIIREYWRTEPLRVIVRDILLDTQTDLVNDVVGVRRSGKTSLMFVTINKLISKFGKEATIYINFENRKLLPLKQEYLFLDEVQRVNEWEKYIRSIYDEYKGKIKIFVSGSSANLLSKDYGKLLTGRHLTSKVYPLSFREFFKFKKISSGINKFKVKALLNEYLRYGGFPEVVLSNEKEAILGQLFNDILSRDVLGRAEIRKEQIVEEFAYYLSSNISNTLSFNKMSKYFGSRGIKVSVQTLENYFYFMKDSFFFFDNLIFSYKVKDQLQYSRKIYCIDTGIANLIGFKFSEDKSKFYENAVAIELLRRSSIQTKVFYWHDQQQREVDFVVKEGLKVKQLIQVCYDIDNYDTKKREIRALTKASKELRCSNLLVITEDKEGEEKIDRVKIKFIPLWRWLLEKR